MIPSDEQRHRDILALAIGAGILYKQKDTEKLLNVIITIAGLVTEYDEKFFLEKAAEILKQYAPSKAEESEKKERFKFDEWFEKIPEKDKFHFNTVYHTINKKDQVYHAAVGIGSAMKAGDYTNVAVGCELLRRLVDPQDLKKTQAELRGALEKCGCEVCLKHIQEIDKIQEDFGKPKKYDMLDPFSDYEDGFAM